MRKAASPRPERGQSALLPQLENNRYPSSGRGMAGGELDNSHMLNFVKTSKKQMRDVIGQQMPQAKRFFDEGLGVQEKDNQSIKNQKNIMPTFSTSQMLARMRPSVQSSAHGKQQSAAGSRMLELDAGLLQLNDEISEMAASTRGRKEKKHGAFTRERPSLPVTSHVSALVSPRGLMPNPSKASLITDNTYNQYPVSVQETYNQGKTSHSPQGSSTSLATLGRELKHFNRYLDTREMQIRTELEGTQKIDLKLEKNKLLQELYQQSIIQVRQKLPITTQTLSDLVKRISEGLSECFELQEKSYIKKVEIRDKKIQQYKNDILKIKDEFYEFKKNSTMDAYFKKHHDVIMRTGRKEKDYLKELQQTVDDFLGAEPSQLNQLEVADEREVTKDVEPSGVDSLLVQMHQQAKAQEIPIIQENPLTTMDAERPAIFNEMKKALNNEAQDVRNTIEQHVRKQLGMIKPLREQGTQSLTYDRIRDKIIEQTQREIEEKLQQRLKAVNDVKIHRLQGDIDDLIKKNKNMKNKFTELQNKMASNSEQTLLDDLKRKVNYFFKKKLGKKSSSLLKEFNEQILQIAHGEIESPASPIRKKKTKKVKAEDSDDYSNSRKKKPSQFEIDRESQERRNRISDQNINTLLKQSTQLAKALSSRGSSVVSLNMSMEGTPAIAQLKLSREDSMPIEVIDQMSQNSLIESEKLDDDSEDKSPTREEPPKEKAKDEVEPIAEEEKIPEKKEQKEEVVEETKKQPELKIDTKLVEEENKVSPPGSPKKASPPESPKKAAGATAKSSFGASKKGGSPTKSKKGKKSPSPKPPAAEQIQDEAPPEKVQTEEPEKPQQPVEKDNRKELMEKLKTSYKTINSSLKDFLSAEKIKISVSKAQKVTEALTRILASAEVANKILKLNSEESDLISTARGLLSRAFELNQKLGDIRATQSKVQSAQEIHQSLAQVSKFLNAQKKSKGLPDKVKIQNQQNSLDFASEKALSLPSKPEVQQLVETEKQASAIDKELETLFATKFAIQKPETSNSAKTTAGLATALPPETPVSMPATQPVAKQDPVTEAIGGINLVKEQIQESHHLLLTSSDVGPQEQKMIGKVQKLLSHMNEAIDWLSQNKEDGGGLLTAISSEQSGRAPSEHQQEKPKSHAEVRIASPGIAVDTDGSVIIQQEQYQPKKALNKQTPSHAAVDPEIAVEKMHQLLKAEDRNDRYEPTHQPDQDPKEAKRVNAEIKALKVQTNLGNLDEVLEIDTPGRTNGESQQRKSSNTIAQSEGGMDLTRSAEKSSRIEVFRKTPIKQSEKDKLILKSPRGGSPLTPEQIQEYGDQTPPSSLDHSRKPTAQEIVKQNSISDVNLEASIDNNQQNIDKEHRMQFAELDQMDQEINGGNVPSPDVPRTKGSSNNQNQIKDIATHLRQSGAETDYLKTTSQFGLDTARAELKTIAIGNVKTNAQANETSDFFHNLKSTVAKDQKKPILQMQKQNPHIPTAEVFINPQTKEGMQETTPTLNINNELEDTKRFLFSQATSMVDHEFEEVNRQQPLKPNNINNDALQNKIQPKSQKVVMNQQLKKTAAAALKVREQAPSPLKITQKPYHQQIGQAADIVYNVGTNHVPHMRPKIPQNSVLMLTQETQTENRSLIKYLLTLINETIMKQLEAQSVMMTQEDFHKTVKQLSEAIPNVYEQVKQQSDTFFIDEQLGPQFTTAHLQETGTLHYSFSPTATAKIPRDMSNQDLRTMLDSVYHQNQQTNQEPLRQVVIPQQPLISLQNQQQAAINAASGAVTGGKQRYTNKELSPSSSQKVLHQSPSQRRLQQMHANNSSNDASTQAMANTHLLGQELGFNKQAGHGGAGAPFLQIGDFSRYGNHTLELSQEVKTRVNLRQIGATGGGFIGRKVKVLESALQNQGPQLAIQGNGSQDRSMQH